MVITIIIVHYSSLYSFILIVLFLTTIISFLLLLSFASSTLFSSYWSSDGTIGCLYQQSFVSTPATPCNSFQLAKVELLLPEIDIFLIVSLGIVEKNALSFVTIVTD
jgi:hypothetical protein